MWGEETFEKKIIYFIKYPFETTQKITPDFLYTDCCTILSSIERAASTGKWQHATDLTKLQQSNQFLRLFGLCWLLLQTKASSVFLSAYALTSQLLFAHHHILVLVKCSECRHQTSEKPTKRNIYNQLCIYFSFDSCFRTKDLDFFL